MDDVVLPVPESDLWASLRDIRYGLYLTPTWAECLRKASMTTRDDVIGELHIEGDAKTDDFEQVPISRKLEVVMMSQEEGFGLRWLISEDPFVKSLLRGMYHDHLLCFRDQFEAVRSDMMIILGAGHLPLWG